MTKTAKPHFVIKEKFQKGGSYRDLLPSPILADICQKVTGRRDYTCLFDKTSYNIGRLVILKYQGKKTFISLSELEIRSRNSSFQSLPSALSRFILDKHPKKEMCFYFHPSTKGNFETPYFIFMYRLMKTVKVRFLNEKDYLHQRIVPFTTPEDIIAHKDLLRSRNRANRPTYVTRGANNNIQIFGKTYGANKYETTILCFAISEIASTEVELYQIGEGGLKELPQTSKEAIKCLGVVRIFTSDKTFEIREFQENNSFRSPRYIYNLLEKLGDKKCAFCKCGIPEIIEGAHIWPVAEIKKDNHLTLNQKLDLALDGENGLWLCHNHHKLLDINILRISEDGSIKYRTEINETASNFIRDITLNNRLRNELITNKFVKYLNKRNVNIKEELYSELNC